MSQSQNREYLALKQLIASGNPPDDLPQCYGVLWEAIVEDSPCAQCDQYAHHCLQAYREEHFPGLLKDLVKMKQPITIDSLASVARSRPEAVQHVVDLEYEEGCPHTTEVMDEILQLRTPTEDGAEEVEEEAPELLGLDSNEEDEVSEEAEVAAPEAPEEKPKRKAKKKVAKKKVAKKKVTKKKVTKKKATAKKATPKKRVSKKRRKVGQNPPEAGPAQRAAAPATKRTRKRRASSAEEPADKASRAFQRELEKHKLQALKPGSTRTRKRLGQEHTCELTKNGWLYKNTGETFPTLGKMVTSITGSKTYPSKSGGTRQMSNWSAGKFWDLKKWSEELAQ